MNESPRIEPLPEEAKSLTDKLILFCLRQKVVIGAFVLLAVAAGIFVAPFDWNVGGLEREPVAVDAIPDIGENQQIVFTRWMGRSPQDVEDQVTYPLTSTLLGIPNVKTVRSTSMLGFSSIYVIFDEKVEFYWSRSRILEKLNSLPPGTLPDGVRPTLGPDATALGQVYWYTLEGRDPDGKPIGGWDLHELRTIQDWQVRYALMGAGGVAEAASVGGHVQEYQIDVDPDAMRSHGVKLEQIFAAVKMSNVDVGARTIEINRVEYVIRGLGFLKSIEDIEETVVKVAENVPIRIREVAKVSLGPGLRRGALDKNGAEAVGGVVVVRYGYNPLEAIKNVKKVIGKIAPGLPTRAVIDESKTTRADMRRFARERGFDAYADTLPNHKEWVRWLGTTPRDEWPDWITTSHVTVVPFYDRTGLIYETLGTLDTALRLEILVTVIVVIVMLLHMRSSILISGLLPLAVCMCFVAMKFFGVDANVVALSGIAIAIGTMVDMGIIVCENILRHLESAPPEENRMRVVFRATSEVGSAVLTAVATTVVSFLPVFFMFAAEGKLFRPLAFTKTFALIASVIVALTVIPAAALILFPKRRIARGLKIFFYSLLIAAGVAVCIWLSWWAGILVGLIGLYHVVAEFLPERAGKITRYATNGLAVLLVGVLLSEYWLPLGPEKGAIANLLFVALLIGGLLGLFALFQLIYRPVLSWFLEHKVVFMMIPTTLLLLGAMTWLGFDTVFGFVPLAVGDHHGKEVRDTVFWKRAVSAFPGLGQEFMPPLDEGSYLYMPTTMTHASIGEAMDLIAKQDIAISAIPEVESVVGKLGRADSPLDPAPVSMIETVVNYIPEYITDKDSRRMKFRYDQARGEFVRENGKLVPDPAGMPFRQWRDHIRVPGDIWDEILAAAEVPGATSAPKLQPIGARLVMLQTGMRAPMGVKIKGPDLATIERFGLDIERLLKQAPGVKSSAVIADRIVGKPYLEIDINRKAIARYGLHVRKVQDAIEVAVGGRRITTMVDGRRRFPVRVRYMRELRDNIESLGKILVAAPDGTQIPLNELADIRYVRGPQAIKSENAELIGYVLFDKLPGLAEVDVVEDCRRFLQEREKSGELIRPNGVTYDFAGNYENQIRSQATLALVLPLALVLIFLILYIQFRSFTTTLLVFFGIAIAWAGGFLLVGAYGNPKFMDFELFGRNMRDLFQIHPINLSVAVWVGFLALFGIASDNGVVIATYLDQSFKAGEITTVRQVRQAAMAGAMRRIRPCLMTSATTILALIPVLTSTGRGSDVMIPMAIPSFGGMLVVLISVFFVPVFYCWVKEVKLRRDPKAVNRSGA